MLHCLVLCMLLCIAGDEVLQSELVVCAIAEQQLTGQILVQQLTGTSSCGLNAALQLLCVAEDEVLLGVSRCQLIR